MVACFLSASVLFFQAAERLKKKKKKKKLTISEEEGKSGVRRVPSFFFLIFIYFILSLAVSGLSCGLRDLLLQWAGFSLVVMCGVSLSS